MLPTRMNCDNFSNDESLIEENIDDSDDLKNVCDNHCNSKAPRMWTSSLKNQTRPKSLQMNQKSVMLTIKR